MIIKNNEVNVLDGIICVSFAYGYTVSLLTLNIPLFIITELSWIGWVYYRCKEKDDE